VDHTDGAALCNKVSLVDVALRPASGGGYGYTYKPGGSESGLCNFNFGDLSVTIPFPAAWAPADRPALAAAFAQQCRTPERMRTGWKGMVPYHSATIALYYNPSTFSTGPMKWDTVLKAQPTRVELTCPAIPCPALDLQQLGNNNFAALPVAPLDRPYSARLFSGGKAPVRVNASNAPDGLTVDASGNLSGTPRRSGTYRMTYTVADACPYNTATLAGSASITVKDLTAPKLIAFTVTPDILPSTGGNVTATVKASDNIAILWATLSYTQPDGRQSGMRMMMSSGSPQNGEWKSAWTIPVNVDPTPKTYTVKLSLADTDTNVVNGPTLNIRVAGKSAGPVMPKRPPAP
jgi:hypothetical protein